MRINNNIAALNTHRQLGINGANGQRAIEKLSSGLRINKAGDDAAGLSISEKMRAQVRGLNQASRNAQDGISLIQTAEGALNETHAILQRMRELAVQSANDTNTGVDRGEIQKEITQLTSEITRVGNTTEFNSQALLKGNGVNPVEFQLQIGSNQSQQFTVSIKDMRASALGLANASHDTVAVAAVGVGAEAVSGASFLLINVNDRMTDVSGASPSLNAEFALDVGNATKASAAVKVIDQAIEAVSGERSKLGAYTNRLEHTAKNLEASSENLQAAESRIRDVDMAKEMMEFTKNNILSQAAQAMLAQANQAPQGVLQLLR